MLCSTAFSHCSTSLQLLLLLLLLPPTLLLLS
jgi:hypothetical protein